MLLKESASFVRVPWCSQVGPCREDMGNRAKVKIARRDLLDDLKIPRPISQVQVGVGDEGRTFSNDTERKWFVFSVCSIDGSYQLELKRHGAFVVPLLRCTG